jgi:hypothetical protein
MRALFGLLAVVVLLLGAVTVLAVVLAFTTRTLTYPGKVEVHLTLRVRSDSSPPVLYGERDVDVYHASERNVFVLQGRFMNETASILDTAWGKPPPRRVAVRFYDRPGRVKPHELVFVLRGLDAAEAVPPRHDRTVTAIAVERVYIRSAPAPMFTGELWVSAEWRPE